MAQLVLPPEEYDHPYQGQTVIRWKDTADEVRDACKTPLLPGLGCAHLSDGWCIITLPRTPVLKSAGYTANVVIRHEMAHCNGWPRESKRAHVGPMKSEAARRSGEVSLWADSRR
jgi:hypothetical protein